MKMVIIEYHNFVINIYLDQQIEGNCEHLKSVGFFVENVQKHVVKHVFYLYFFVYIYYYYIK